MPAAAVATPNTAVPRRSMSVLNAERRTSSGSYDSGLESYFPRAESVCNPDQAVSVPRITVVAQPATKTPTGNGLCSSIVGTGGDSRGRGASGAITAEGSAGERRGSTILYAAPATDSNVCVARVPSLPSPTSTCVPGKAYREPSLERT